MFEEEEEEEGGRSEASWPLLPCLFQGIILPAMNNVCSKRSAATAAAVDLGHNLLCIRIYYRRARNSFRLRHGMYVCIVGHIGGGILCLKLSSFAPVRCLPIRYSTKKRFPQSVSASASHVMSSGWLGPHHHHHHQGGRGIANHCLVQHVPHQGEQTSPPPSPHPSYPSTPPHLHTYTSITTPQPGGETHTTSSPPVILLGTKVNK